MTTTLGFWRSLGSPWVINKLIKWQRPIGSIVFQRRRAFKPIPSGHGADVLLVVDKSSRTPLTHKEWNGGAPGVTFGVGGIGSSYLSGNDIAAIVATLSVWVVASSTESSLLVTRRVGIAWRAGFASIAFHTRSLSLY
jgi:hypothetical protein